MTAKSPPTTIAGDAREALEALLGLDDALAIEMLIPWLHAQPFGTTAAALENLVAKALSLAANPVSIDADRVITEVFGYLPSLAAKYSVHPTDAESPGQWRDRVRKAALSANISAERARMEAVEGWQDIATCDRKGQSESVIIAVTSDTHLPVVGEAYFNPEAYDGTWWWAGTAHGEYADSPVEEIQHGTVTHWRQLPAPPESPAS